MKKLIVTISCVLGMGVFTANTYAQDEDIDSDEDSILTHSPRSEEASWLVSLVKGAAEIEEDADDVFESILAADTYLTFSSFYSVADNVEMDDVPESATTSFTLSMVHENNEILEIERYMTDESRTITSPQAYANRVNGEMFIYNTSTGSFEDMMFSGFTYDDIMLERYNNVYDTLEENLADFNVYENVDYFIFVGTELDSLLDQFLDQSGWAPDTLNEDSFFYEYIILVNKETSLIEYNGLMTNGESLLDNQNYISEHYTYYYDVDVYENIDVMHEENAFEAAPNEVEEDNE